MALVELCRDKAPSKTRERLRHLKTDILSSRMSELFIHRSRKPAQAERNAQANMGNSLGLVVASDNFEFQLHTGRSVIQRNLPKKGTHAEIIILDDSDDDITTSTAAHRSKRQRLDVDDTLLQSADVDDSDSKHPTPSSSETKFEQAPFYKDPLYDVVMYRGPGYDMFPVVLGTVPGHEELCKQWEDSREHTILYDPETKSELVGYVLKAENGDTPSNTPPTEEEPLITEKERELLTEIMVILPNIQRKYALEQIDKYTTSQTPETVKLELPLVVERIVEQILSASTAYPQIEDRRKPVIVEKGMVDPTGHTITWDKTIKKDRDYVSNAVLFLSNEFERVPHHFIRSQVKTTMSLFDTYLTIYNAEANYSESNKANSYTHLKTQKLVLDRRHLKTGIRRRDDAVYAQMVNEFQAAKQHVTREAIRQVGERDRQDDEMLNFVVHEVNGELVECQCCFDSDIPINRAVICEGTDIHFFCFGCVTRLAESQVGIMKYEMQCMDGSGCKAMLPNSGVHRAVPQKLLDRLTLNEQQAVLREADIEGLERCESCEFMAICPPVDVDSEFACQNPDCRKVTCRKCKKPSHLPQKCREEEHLDARHRVEEARSEAMMRACPKCKVKIIKETGCNKMPCTNCNTIMCYVCKQDITSDKEGGYHHFRKIGASCPLFDKTDVDRHATEADEAEKKAIEAARKKDAGLDAALLAIETKKLPAKVAAAIPPRPRLPNIPPLPRLLNNPPPQPVPLAPPAAVLRQHLAGINLLRRGHV